VRSVLLLLLAGCAVESLPSRPPAPEVLPPLPQVFACLRERRLALVSAHRGQPRPGAAENALSSLRATHGEGPILIEIDIGRTADDALVLLHDDDLDRTTTGTGPLAAKTLADVRRLRLRDGEGRVLEEGVPTLDEALVWARRNNVVLQLDLKGDVPLARVVDAVRQAGVERQVVLITYGLADARAALRLAPDMMVSASGRDATETATLLREGAGNPRLLGFTGTTEPPAALLDRLSRAGIGVITGTLGRPGERLDDRYMADGDGREYADLAARGVQLIASDRPLDAWAALREAGRDGRICLGGQAQ
jgi:glycerophosphoryl diester phosphodiesterase